MSIPIYGYYNVFIACFAVMQRSLMGMIGLRYKDMFAIMKKRWGK